MRTFESLPRGCRSRRSSRRSRGRVRPWRSIRLGRPALRVTSTSTRRSVCRPARRGSTRSFARSCATRDGAAVSCRRSSHWRRARRCKTGPGREPRADPRRRSSPRRPLGPIGLPGARAAASASDAAVRDDLEFTLSPGDAGRSAGRPATVFHGAGDLAFRDRERPMAPDRSWPRPRAGRAHQPFASSSAAMAARARGLRADRRRLAGLACGRS